MLDVAKIKRDFPIFKNDPNLIYLDSTATALKPQIVIDKLLEYYQNYSANVFRGVYKISEKATAEYEATRDITAKYIGAKREEVVFTRGVTEGLNLLAYCLGRQTINQDDEIVTSVMEHHSNFVPWQQLAAETGAVLKVIDVDDEGKLKASHFTKASRDERNLRINLENIVTPKTKIIALTYVSNVLGTVNPIKEIIREAKRINPKIIAIIDAAQAIPHLPLDVRDLDCDFLVFSGHKMLGPTGVGVLWGRYQLLESIFPFHFGGEMIETVSLGESSFKKPPHKFEAGTPAIAEVIALKEAVKYLEQTGLKNISQHEQKLARLAIKQLKIEFGDEVRIIGASEKIERSGIVTFTLDNFHAHDVAQILDEANIAVRAGNHCAMPLHQRFGLTATIRASFYLYNNEKDIEKLISGLKEVKKTLRN